MKERGIIFSGPMVRALLDGRKTQTRRVVKVESNPRINHAWNPGLRTGEYTFANSPVWHFGNRRNCSDGTPSSHCAMIQLVKCPYGTVGARLWVKETWLPLWDSGAGFFTCLCPTGHENKPDKIRYRVDGEKPKNFAAKWRSPRFMPRWASRITLEITDVRVERVQEISNADVMAEGVIQDRGDGETWYNGKHQHIYAAAWDKINGPDSWAANPWVWVVQFRRLEESQ